MDRFLGKAGSHGSDDGCNRSCGCGADDNWEAILEQVLSLIKPADQQSIAQELELGSMSQVELIRHFRLNHCTLPWLKSSMLRYVLHRLWKRWTEELWERLGENLMVRMWNMVQSKGLRAAAEAFQCTIAEMKAVGRWFSKKVFKTDSQQTSLNAVNCLEELIRSGYVKRKGSRRAFESCWGTARMLAIVMIWCGELTPPSGSRSCWSGKKVAAWGVPPCPTRHS